MLEGLLYNSIRERFPILDVVRGNLKSFFQLHYQVDISCYLMNANALCYSKELALLTSSWCTSSPISLPNQM